MGWSRLTEQGGTVQVFDVRRPSAPQMLLRVAGTAGAIAALDGGSLVIADAGVLRSYDLVSGAQIGQVTLPGNGAVEDIHLTNGEVFAIRHDTGAQQFTVSATALGATGGLTAQSSVAFAGVEPISLGANLSGGDGVLFVGGISTNVASVQPGFATINIANTASLAVISGSTPSAVTDFAPDGTGLAISATRVAGSAVLDVFNVSNPANTGTLVTTFPLSIEAKAVAVAGGLGLVVDRASFSVVRFAGADTTTQAPTASITSPASGGTVISGALVPVHVVATDNAQIAKVELLLHGDNVVATDTSFPFDASFIVPAALPAGTALEHIK